MARRDEMDTYGNRTYGMRGNMPQGSRSRGGFGSGPFSGARASGAVSLQANLPVSTHSAEIRVHQSTAWPFSTYS